MMNDRKRERLEKFSRHKRKKHEERNDEKFKPIKKRNKYKLNINDLNIIDDMEWNHPAQRYVRSGMKCALDAEGL